MSDTTAPHKPAPDLPWIVADPKQSFYDGDQVLCRVPMADGGFQYAVVSVDCDSDYFNLRVEGECWGWEWSDVEAFIVLPGNDPLAKLKATQEQKRG